MCTRSEGAGLLYADCAREGEQDELAALDRRATTHPWTCRHFAAELAGPLGAVIVLRSARPAGIIAYCVLHAVAAEGEIRSLAVDPGWRGRGLGRLVLDLALRALERRGAESVFLEVRAGNAVALRLYRQAGFRSCGRRVGYYSEPREDAIVMRRSISDAT